MKKFLFTTIFIWGFQLSILPYNPNIKVGADQIGQIIPLLKNKRVALVVNQTSVCGSNQIHLVDTLLSLQVQVVKIFAPEHGFRGTADAGEKVLNSMDEKTNLPILSLYGKNKKPSSQTLADVEVIIFDIQDVGARFYTYISTLFYIMEACSEQHKQLIILDRPNPNDYIDGPVLQESLKSFVGIVPIPLMHGLTVGELAQMIVGQKWLSSKSSAIPFLHIVPVKGWKHGDPYLLPVKPSPNLPNDLSVKLYPSLCLFEGTPVSIGRGTRFPFQVIGYPQTGLGDFSFTPVSLPGFEKNPLQKDIKCFGTDLRNKKTERAFTLKYILDYYKKTALGEKFFSSPHFFDQLCGDSRVRQMIIEGKTERQIKTLWHNDLVKYKQMRKSYLLYAE